MAEEGDKNHSEGVDLPKLPSPPAPDGIEKPEEPASKGIPRWVTVAGAIVGTVATLAGIAFGMLQIRNASQHDADERAQEQRQFQLSLKKEEDAQRDSDNQFKLQLEQMSSTAAKNQADALSQQKQAEAAKAQADAAAADAREREAQEAATKAQSELERQKLEARESAHREFGAAVADVLKLAAQDFQKLSEAKAKLRSARTPEDAVAALATIVQFVGESPNQGRAFELIRGLNELQGPPKPTPAQTDEDRQEAVELAAQQAEINGVDEYLRRTREAARDALEERLDSDSLPSAAELDIIFASLPDVEGHGDPGEPFYSGPIEIATRANQRAWKLLDKAIYEDWIAYTRNTPANENHRSDTGGRWFSTGPDPTHRIFVDDEWLERVERRLAPLRIPGVGSGIASTILSRRSLQHESLYAVAGLDLDSVVAMISGSRNAIERAILPQGLINLDGCFLPGFAPRLEHPFSGIEISLHNTWIGSADLRGLGNVTLRFNKDSDSTEWPLGLDNPGVAGAQLDDTQSKNIILD